MGLVVAMLAVCGLAALVRLFLRWGRYGRGLAVSLGGWGIDLSCGLYGLWVVVEFVRTLLGLWCWLPLGVRAVFGSPKCAFRIVSMSCTLLGPLTCARAGG